jgi:hypothetical protein
MPYSAYFFIFVPPNKQLDPVLCSIGKWLIGASVTAYSNLLKANMLGNKKDK